MTASWTEHRVGGEQERVYSRQGSGLLCSRQDAAAARLSWATLLSLASTMLLPKGFPRSVCPEYVAFQLWDTLQEACGYFKGILTSRAWLTGLGVGNATGNVVGALTATMIINYGAMVCGLLCASPGLVTRFASDMKLWRLVAEILHLVASVFTIAAGAKPHLFLPLSCAGAVLGAMGSVAGGVSRAPLISHLARAHNEADVSAKEGSQSRLLKLVAIAAGYRFLLWVDAEGSRASIAFVALAALKLAFQYRATTVLELRTLNAQRLALLLRVYLAPAAAGRATGAPSPAAIARQERVFGWRPRPAERVHMGVSLTELAGRRDRAGEDAGAAALAALEGADERGFALVAGADGVVRVALAVGAGAVQQLEAHLHAAVLLRHQEGGQVSEDAGAEARRRLPAFLEALREQGWETEHLLLGDEEWRFEPVSHANTKND